MMSFHLVSVLISSLVFTEQIRGKQADQVYGEITDWISGFDWIKTGRDVCRCEKYKSQAFCDNMKKKGHIECLEGRRGSKLLVKKYGLDSEVQAKFDPTPSRGIAFIRSVEIF